MLPITLDPQYLKALVIGKGPATTRRLEMLESAGVKNVKYIESNPQESDFDNINIVYVADFDDEVSAQIAQMGRARNILLNVEDKLAFCDFHTPAIIRRGDLLITVSTNGKAPRLARRIRQKLEKMFDESWGPKLDIIARARDNYKTQGFKFDSMAKKLDVEIEKLGLFKNKLSHFIKTKLNKKN